MENSSQEGNFIASDILKLAGLTYRQLNDWENRAGVLESKRATDAGWRKFTTEEVLALCICASLRRELSLPLERIGKLYRWLAGKSPTKKDELFAALARTSGKFMEENPKFAEFLKLKGEDWKKALGKEPYRLLFEDYHKHKIGELCTHPALQAMRIANYSLPAYLYTDLDKDYDILTEFQLVDFLAERLTEKPLIVYSLNKIVNLVRHNAGLPQCVSDQFTIPFKKHLSRLEERPIITAKEQEVIEILRNKAYRKVVVHLQNGEILHAKAEEVLANMDESKMTSAILDAIKNKSYATIAITKKNGKTVEARIDNSIKFDVVAGRT